MVTQNRYPPLIGGIKATVSPLFSGNISPVGTYSSFNANASVSSSETIEDRAGYFSASIFLTYVAITAKIKRVSGKQKKSEGGEGQLYQT